jgi:carotenoid cleavage dioxygenase
MGAPFPTNNPYLAGGFRPIGFECDYADLIIDGKLPREIAGSLYRIGPNPQFTPRGVYNPLRGDGMIHVFHMHAGRASYRNRWVRTQQFQRERAACRSLFATSGNPHDADPEVAGIQTDGVANTALVWQANRLLALEEGHPPIEIHPDALATLGAWTFAGQLPGNMTAHPKIDPLTGEMLFFANFPRHDLSGVLELYRADVSGKLVQQSRIELPFPALIHDFTLTRDWVIFFVCPLTVSLDRLRNGGAAIAWEPQRSTWVGIVSRATLADPAWLPIRPLMVWHFMNAYNEGDAIYVDVCQQEAAAFPTTTGTIPDPARLQQFATRWTFSGKHLRDAREERLSELVCEYPTVDSRDVGRRHRYGYVACRGGPGTGDPFHRGIARLDLVTRQSEVFAAGARCAVSEPLFVPRHASAEEGDGYLFSVVFDERCNASHLAIFDAQNIRRGPIARVLLDHRLPMGFHGLWKSR